MAQSEQITPSKNNPVCVYDFTASCDKISLVELLIFIRKIAKAYAFQQEKGEETGYLHYQGRISLKIKKRLSEALKLFKDKPIHISVTSTANHENDFYVLKEETRVGGPWTDRDVEKYIPRQYRHIIENLYPYQRAIIDSITHFEPRTINIIIDTLGNNGKSTIAALCEILYDGIDCPPLNDYKEIVQVVSNELIDRNCREPKIVLFDMPRAIRKDQLYGFFSAIEQIKKGKVYDTRYHYKKWWFDSPAIWVFTNSIPERRMLSMDRWKLWTINDEKELVKFSFGESSEFCNNIEFNSSAQSEQDCLIEDEPDMEYYRQKLHAGLKELKDI